MSIVYFPSCQMKDMFPELSQKAADYVKQRLGIDPIGCCRVNHPTLEEGDTAVVLCHNCAAIIEENTKAQLKYLWEIVDEDPDFVFPDYHGEKMTVQDCFVAYDRREMQDSVRSVLRKMHIVPIEIEGDNYEKATFCSKRTFPCPEGNKKMVPHRYTEVIPHMFGNVTDKEAYYQEHAEKITTDKVVCSCRACLIGIREAGKDAGFQGVHLLELLFAEKE